MSTPYQHQDNGSNCVPDPPSSDPTAVSHSKTSDLNLSNRDANAIFDKVTEVVGSGKKTFSKDTPSSIRQMFVRKVYTILTIQLASTFGIVAFFVFVSPLREYSKANIWILALSTTITALLFPVTGCFPRLWKMFPINLLLLIVFTIFEGLFLGSLSANYTEHYILYAVALIFGQSLVVVVLSFTLTFDFTNYYIYLIVAGFCLGVFGIVGGLHRSKVIKYAYATLGSLLSSLFLLFESQIIIKGKKEEITEDDYILAVLMLYTDIINIFQNILKMLEKQK